MVKSKAKGPADDPAVTAFLASEKGVLFLNHLANLSDAARGLASLLKDNLPSVFPELGKRVRELEDLTAAGQPSSKKTKHNSDATIPKTPASKVVPAEEQPDETETKTRKKRAPKDPNAPKAPAPPFLLYRAEMRDTLKQKYPDLSNTELTKKMGELWRNLTEEEKQPYNDKFASARYEYASALDQYKAKVAAESEQHSPVRTSESNQEKAKPKAKKTGTPASAKAQKIQSPSSDGSESEEISSDSEVRQPIAKSTPVAKKGTPAQKQKAKQTPNTDKKSQQSLQSPKIVNGKSTEASKDNASEDVPEGNAAGGKALKKKKKNKKGNAGGLSEDNAAPHQELEKKETNGKAKGAKKGEKAGEEKSKARGKRTSQNKA
ncbi:hypothetical protein HK102_011380 [Quaeritorhiza haematococci]|nr:hypothetical protein HK102_011380 [Quaeritorhiza haematococci]